MDETKQNYKKAVETLVSAQELLIKYSKCEVSNRICWGVLFLILGFLPPFTYIWINVIMLIFAGINLHSAVNEHRFYKIFKNDLELLKELENRSHEENNQEQS